MTDREIYNVDQQPKMDDLAVSTATILDEDVGGMSLFAALVNTLGTSTKTNDKLEALQHYFSTAQDEDKVWVIALFSGRRPKRAVNATLLSLWCMEINGYEPWLFEECYHTVGDLAETIALLLPDPEADRRLANQSLTHYLHILMKIEKEPEAVKKVFVTDGWRWMDRSERFVFNKLITGGFRIGVSQKMIVNALAKTIKVSPSVIAHRISGNWDPSTTGFNDLLSETTATVDHSKPYPFYLAYALEATLDTLGDPADWQAEWKWDGIRGEIIKRNHEIFVWSRGEELMTEKFPEYNSLQELLPEGTALDGEIISGRKNEENANGFEVLPFANLQTRIGRKNITKKQLQEAPVIFIAYDMLEFDGVDLRGKSLEYRRSLLEEMIRELDHPGIFISPIVSFSDWETLEEKRGESRDNGAEGFMLKRRNSPYLVGRKRGDWWKWKIEPLVIDAVMIYAQKGHGRRSNLYTDYTFAVRDGEKLVTFTKAYSGLTDKEFNEVDNFVKRNSIEKFGPVRTVKAELVFEIAFEGIAASNRHKSGVALRFPRINRWRKDKKPDEINTIEDLRQMLEQYGK